MKHLLLLSFLWIAFILHAQTGDSLFTPKLTGELYVTEAKYSGDIFFNNHWAESTILLSSGSYLYGEKIKYHGYLDEVIWYNSSNFTPFILDKDYISAFWTTDSLKHPVHFKHLQLSDSTSIRPKDFYAQVAVEGRYSLYIQRRVINLPDEVIVRKDGTYAQKAYGQSPLYFIQLPSGKFIVLKHLSRRAFLNLFPEQKETLSALIRKHGIRLRSEKGLTEMVTLMTLDS
jgi:hypothetical protein